MECVFEGSRTINARPLYLLIEVGFIVDSFI